MGVRAQEPPAQPRFTGGGTLGAKRPTSASPEQNAEEARIVALQLNEIDGLLDLVKVVSRSDSLLARNVFAVSEDDRQEAPAEELVPALEMLFKIFSAILDKPAEPKVGPGRLDSAVRP